MNTTTQPETPFPWNRVSARDAMNRDKLDDEVEKYRHLEELAELFDDPSQSFAISRCNHGGVVLLAADARND